MRVFVSDNEQENREPVLVVTARRKTKDDQIAWIHKNVESKFAHLKVGKKPLDF